MSYEITGIVEGERKDRKAIKVDGEWYSVFKPDQLNDCRYKDNVSFLVEEKEKEGRTFKNIKGEVTVLDGGGSPVASRTAATAGPVRQAFPVPANDRERSIIRRHAVSAAIEYCTNNEDGLIEVPHIIELAREIELYTSGDEYKEALGLED